MRDAALTTCLCWASVGPVEVGHSGLQDNWDFGFFCSVAEIVPWLWNCGPTTKAHFFLLGHVVSPACIETFIECH